MTNLGSKFVKPRNLPWLKIANVWFVKKGSSKNFLLLLLFSLFCNGYN